MPPHICMVGQISTFLKEECSEVHIEISMLSNSFVLLLFTEYWQVGVLSMVVYDL
jgi:hypothetical protein